MVVVVVDLVVAQITLKMNLVLVNIDSHITYQEIEDVLQIGSAATQSILHDYIGLKKVTCRWVSHFLTEAQKQDRVDYCLKMLEKFDDDRSKRVYDIIIGDESWFYYYNASAHKATQTMEYLEAQRVKLMGHPAYSLDLSPCDFWLFPKIKEQLRGKNFQDINEIHAAVQEQMDGLRKEDFYQCYEQWFERMNKCISAQEHYFEQI